MKKITRRQIVWAFVFALILILEFGFDFFEICLGEIMRITNPLRPRAGRYWVNENRAAEGSQEAALLEPARFDSVSYAPPVDLQDLLMLLSFHESITVTREDFLKFYNNMTKEQQIKFIEPLQLYHLSRTQEWQRVRIRQTNRQIVVHFLDRADLLLKENYVAIGQESTSGDSGVDIFSFDNPEYSGRIVDGNNFYAAFDKLSKQLQLQIINDPSLLLRWQDDLKSVAISGYVRDGSVKIECLVVTDLGQRKYELNASELAIGYLVGELNQLGVQPQITLPEKEGVGK
ncbi:hypothetical protein JW935_05500 [candidate division KSB1 bacterium]|nr:hypothetical protein [candidate division KSB1 bacterium]